MTQGAALRLGTLVLAALVCIRIALELVNPVYDWDADHEIYFAQRLLQAEMLWTQEFHDKLPVVAMLFTPAAWAESITAHRLMSLGAALLSAFAFLRLAPGIFGQSKEAEAATRFSALSFIALMLITPGSISGLNAVSTSAQLIAVLLILTVAARHDLSGGSRLVAYALGGLCGAIAISARPYFIADTFVIVLAAGALALLGVFPRRAAAAVVTGMILWGVAFGIWGLGLNVLPYLLAGELSVFKDGLAMLAAEINPASFIDSFKAAWEQPVGLWFWCSVVLLLVAFVLGCTLSQGERARVCAVAVVSVLGLAAMLLMMSTKHYWGHYVALFAAGYVMLQHGCLSLGPARFGLLLALIPIGSLLAITSAETALRGARVTGVLPAGGVVPWQAEADAVAAHLAAHSGAQPSFLAPLNMQTHWRLGEPRHGFPHAANTTHVFKGWWTSVPDGLEFFAPADGAAYCARLSEAGPDLLYLQASSPVIACFEDGNMAYEATEELREGGILVFQRKAPQGS